MPPVDSIPQEYKNITVTQFINIVSADFNNTFSSDECLDPVLHKLVNFYEDNMRRAWKELEGCNISK